MSKIFVGLGLILLCVFLALVVGRWLGFVDPDFARSYARYFMSMSSLCFLGYLISRRGMDSSNEASGKANYDQRS